MKKYTPLILLIIISIYIYTKTPKYNELNNIIIIDKITISCNNNQIIKLREIKPQKESNKISYKYKTYKINTNDINNLNIKLKNKYKKNFYYKKAKIINICKNKELE